MVLVGIVGVGMVTCTPLRAMHGWQHECQEDYASPPEGTGEDHQATPTPSSMIWDVTISHSLKQLTWLRIAVCGGCCRCPVLCTLKVACQKWTNERTACCWLYKQMLLPVCECSDVIGHRTFGNMNIQHGSPLLVSHLKAAAAATFSFLIGLVFWSYSRWFWDT